MAGKLAGTKTEKNLKDAFAGESMARNKYTFFAGEARKAGLLEIASVFETTANEEKEHAKRMFKFLDMLAATDANLEAVHRGREHGVDRHVRPDGEGGRGGGVRPDRPLLHPARRRSRSTTRCASARPSRS